MSNATLDPQTDRRRGVRSPAQPAGSSGAAVESTPAAQPGTASAIDPSIAAPSANDTSANDASANGLAANNLSTNNLSANDLSANAASIPVPSATVPSPAVPSPAVPSPAVAVGVAPASAVVQPAVATSALALIPVDAPARRPRRRRWVLGVAAVVGVAVVGLLATRYMIHAYHFESTDDAFVEAHVVSLRAKVPGYVTDVRVEDNQHVRAGDVLVQIDARDYQAAVASSAAQVASAQARLDEAQSRLVTLQATVTQSQAEVSAAEATGRFAKSEAERFAEIGSNAVSVQEQQNARTAAQVADANVAAARGKLAASQADLANGQSQIKTAGAELKAAQAKAAGPGLDLEATTLRAPVTGRVTRRAVEPGAYLSNGQSLMAIVPDDVYVVANFKETQLTNMHAGQPVELSLDAYPGRTFEGKVDSIQRGTGSRFSLLPSENATGNYVKIVQRVPVKITLNARPDGDLVLAPGMSVEPEVKVR